MALGWLWWRAWAGVVAADAAALCVAGVAPSFDVAGVALGDIYLRFAWQAWHLGHNLRFAWPAWHLATFAFVSRGRRGTCVAFGDICLHFTWQAWHLVTFTFVLRGMRGT